ncbi:MAG: hypothetical protein HY344_03080 [Candidatus Levybacteria bacterium]|nr:hypothetical protein [Candidatus Levybacteria bacterium]
MAKKMIFQFKNKPYLTDLQNFLTELFYESLIQNEGFIELVKRRNWVFVASPLSKEIFRKRGYNQAEILARSLGKKLKIQTIDINKINRTFRNVFIVDDVVKTGRTLQKASNDLKRRGSRRVYGLILAGS